MAKQQNKIAEVRKSKGVTQQQLADKLGVHWVTISKLERGVMQLTFEWAEKLAQALGASFADIFQSNADREIAVEADLSTAMAVSVTENPQRFRVTRPPYTEALGTWMKLTDRGLEPYFCQGDIICLADLVRPAEKGTVMQYRDPTRLALIIADDETKHFGVFVERHSDGSEDFRLINGRTLARQKNAALWVVADYIPAWAIDDIAD